MGGRRGAAGRLRTRLTPAVDVAECFGLDARIGQRYWIGGPKVSFKDLHLDSTLGTSFCIMSALYSWSACTGD